MTFTLLLVVHLLSAMLAFGSSASIGIWAASAHADPAHLAFTLRTLQRLDRFLIDPFYTLAGVTGVLLVQVSGIPWSTLWVVVSLVLWVVATGLAHGLLRPTIRKQSLILEEFGPNDARYVALAGRSQLAGTLLSVIAVVMVVLMSWKPI